MQGLRVWIGPAAALSVCLMAGGGALAAPPADPEEMRAAMEQVMVIQLKRALQLSPAQEDTVMPQVERLLAARREFAAQRRAALSHLRAVMIDETADDGDIEEALRDVESVERRFRDREQGLRDAINSGLTPRQQARLYFFQERFRRKVQERLREAAGERRRGPDGMGPRGPRRGGPPPGEDE